MNFKQPTPQTGILKLLTLLVLLLHGTVAADAFRGRVITVTTLECEGPGSLRAALEAGGPRTVVFNVSGQIELSRPLVVRNPHAYVAGGTAANGICVRGEIEVVAAGVSLEGLDTCSEGHWPLAVKDTDGDGIPDAWERRAGLNWENPADGTWDQDQDGETNLQAYLKGTLGEGEAVSWPLEADRFRHHIEFFNEMEPERIVNSIPNSASWDWLSAQVPLFECPDAVLEEIYYYRWWALRKHIKEVGPYQVYTEFIELDTKAPFIPPERTIASALGHHFMETRWLKDQTADDSYLSYWMRGKDGGPQDHFHQYSSWLAEALWERTLVTGDFARLEDRFEELLADYRRWQSEKQREDGLYWQYDVWDAMEESISGSRHEKNIRPTINSYMYGNALALAKMASRFGRSALANELEAEAEELREKVLRTLWNPERGFFEVVKESGGHAGVREAIGFIPWYFNLPHAGSGTESAWLQLIDRDGFMAPYGITTAEIRHPEFRSHGVGTCEWDGAVWPYATSQTLGALANALRHYPETPLDEGHYMDGFLTYTRSQYYGALPYIGEYQDERNGVWLKGRNPRSYYYHHSTFADLLITDVLGLIPSDGSELTVDPFAFATDWDWFCLQDVPYRGHLLSLVWDRDGKRYGLGSGFRVFVDGELAGHRDGPGSLTIDLGGG